METDLQDIRLITKKDYENMISLLVRTSFLLSTKNLVDWDTHPRDEGTKLFEDIQEITRPFDDNSPTKFLTK